MGSIANACISGFLCRICLQMNKTVIHIYSDHGQRLGLLEKINNYLPIVISETDQFPKTICKACVQRVEQHYSLMMRVKQHEDELKKREKEKEEQRQREGAERNPATAGNSAQGQDESGAGPSNRNP